MALPCDGVSPLTSGKLKESARKHMSQFLSQATLQDGDEGESGELTQERKTSRELIERTQRHLESIVEKESEDTGLKDLLDVFKAARERKE